MNPIVTSAGRMILLSVVAACLLPALFAVAQTPSLSLEKEEGHADENTAGSDATPSDTPSLFSEAPHYQPFCYRFDDRLEDAVSRESHASATIEEDRLILWPPQADVPHPAEGEGAEVIREEQVLYFTSDAAASLTLADNLSIDTPSVDSLRLRIAVEGTDEIRIAWRFPLLDWDFCSKEGNCWIWMPVESDGNEHTYVVRVDGLDRWLQYRLIEGIQLLTTGPARIRLFGFEVVSRKGLFAQDAFGVREFGIGGEVRQCLHMNTPARLAYRLQLPPNPVLTTGLGLVGPDNPITFKIQLIHEDEEILLLDKTIDTQDRWHEQRIALDAYAGADVEVVFEATSESEGQVALWSNPAVYEADSGAQAGRMPNILFYLVDALRADRTEPYGYDLPTSPTLAQLAETGVVFQHYFTHTTCTKPSVMTLFSGVDALVHGFRCFIGLGIPEMLTLFPVYLRAAGYSTGAVSENPFAPPVSVDQRAFCHLTELDEITAAVSGQTYAAATAFLEEHQDRPFFLYVHTMECHGRRLPDPNTYGYLPPPPFEDIWKYQNQTPEDELYDASIVLADQNFKRIMDKLEELGLRENTLVIFTSDHGTELGDRGDWGHGKSPYSDQIHVPLIMNWPGGGGRPGVVHEYVQTADLPDTLLELTGLPVPAHHQGLSLLPLLQDGDKTPFLDRYIVSYNGWLTLEYSVIEGDWKYMINSEGNELLYALPGDLAEQNNLCAEHPEIAALQQQVMTEHFIRHIALYGDTRPSGTPRGEMPIDPARLEMIESLGYLGN